MKCQINTGLLPLYLKACSAHYPSLPEDANQQPSLSFQQQKNPQASCQSTEPSAELEEHFKLEVHPSPAGEYPPKLTAWGMMPHSSAAGKAQLWGTKWESLGSQIKASLVHTSVLNATPLQTSHDTQGSSTKHRLITELMGHVFGWQCYQHG